MQQPSFNWGGKPPPLLNFQRKSGYLLVYKDGFIMDLKVFFDNQACKWDEEQSSYRPPVEELLSSLHLSPGEDVLEIGCGSGWLMGDLGRRIAPGRLYALDFSGEMLRRATVKRFGFPVVIIHSNAEDIPLPDNAVDRVVMINTFSHFPKPQLVISEAARVLRKGGRLDIKYFFSREDINSHHVSFPSLQGLGIPDNQTLFSWFESAGFISTTDDRKDGFHFSSYLVRQ